VSPSELKEYLAVLPQNAAHVELVSGDFRLSLRLGAPPAPAGQGVAGEIVGDMPAGLLELFPQLEGRRGA
jgi:hypothetical protein